MLNIVELDRPREIKWTPRAQIRNASLDRPVDARMAGRRASRAYVLVATIWASLVDKDHGFTEPEELAQYVDTPEKSLAAWKVVNAMFEAEKKSRPNVASSGLGPKPSPTDAPASPTGGA